MMRLFEKSSRPVSNARVIKIAGEEKGGDSKNQQEKCMHHPSKQQERVRKMEIRILQLRNSKNLRIHVQTCKQKASIVVRSLTLSLARVQ